LRGAVLHQHEIGSIDRQGLVRDEGVFGEQRQSVADLLGGFDLGRGGAGLAALGDEPHQAGIVCRQSADTGCSGEIAMKEAPNRVSGRVV